MNRSRFEIRLTRNDLAEVNTQLDNDIEALIKHPDYGLDSPMVKALSRLFEQTIRFEQGV